MILAVKSIIQRSKGDSKKNLCERVLWIDRNKDEIVVYPLIDLNDAISKSEDKSLPQVKKLSDVQNDLLTGLAFIRPVDHFERRIDYNDSRVNKYITKRDRLWEIVGKYLKDEPDIYDKKLRGVMITEIMACNIEGLKTKRSIYRVFRKYWRYGKTKEGLLELYEEFGAPGKSRVITKEVLNKVTEKLDVMPKRGKPRSSLILAPDLVGINIDESTLRLMLSVVKNFYNTSDKPTLTGAYQYLLENYYNVGVVVKDGIETPIIDPKGRYPSIDQFKYHFYKNRDLKDELIKREGKNRFNLSKRAVLGSSTENKQLGAGSVYQIDSTIASIYLVNRFDRTRIIGKPTVYLVIDVLTRKITGRYVSVNDPSWMALQMTLFDAFSCVSSTNVSSADSGSDHINFHEGACYLPEEIVWDRAREQLGIASDNITDIFETRIVNTASYRADWKGIIEQMFNQLREKIRRIGGSVKKGQKERGEADYRKDAHMDIEKFTDIVDEIIKHHNNHYLQDYPLNEKMLHDNVDPYPNELWEWSLQNQGVLRQFSAQKVMFHLLPKEKAIVTEHGVKFEGRHYSSLLIEDWFVKARSFKSWEIQISFDKRDTRYIYLLSEERQTIERCTLLPKDSEFEKYHFEEIADVNRREKVKARLHTKHNPIQYQSTAELNAFIDATSKSEKVKTEKALLEKGMNNLQINALNMEESRAEERERTRKDEAWTLGFTEKEKPTENVVSSVITTDTEDEMEPSYSPHNSMLNKLKRRKGV